METVLIEKLDKLIAELKAASIPVDQRWLDAEGIGAMMSFSARYVLENITCHPDFPRPFRLDGKGHPRWLGSEVMQWAKAQRDARVGRPRTLDRERIVSA